MFLLASYRVAILLNVELWYCATVERKLFCSYIFSSICETRLYYYVVPLLCNAVVGLLRILSERMFSVKTLNQQKISYSLTARDV